MHIYLINLSKDTDRLRAMTDQLAALSLPFERVEAVYGTHMPDWLKPYFLRADDTIASELLPGEVGCYASHLKVLQMIADSGKPGLVLEDDLYIAKDFPSVLDSMANLPDDWDIIRLSNPYKRRFFPVKPLNSTYRAVKFSRVPPSTGAYVISPEGARKFLAWKRLRTLPVDQDLRRTWDCRLVTYGVYPRPIVPDVFVSSIDGMVKRPGHRRPEVSGLSGFAQRVAYDVRWLGAVNWALALLPRKYPDPLSSSAWSSVAAR